jgi:RNA polymerase sigma-70 factor, ECF subfamily
MTRSGISYLQSVPTGAQVTGNSEWQPANTPAQDADAMVTQLYKDYADFILSYVTGLLKDRYLAEDVVQETMLRAWRYCDQFSADKGSVRGWLMKVAHNIAVDKIRMRESRPTEVTHNNASLALVEDHADTVLTSLQIRAALARLSPEHRAIVEHVYLNGCTAREAAERLGIPEGTAFSRAFYALRMLRRELGLTQSGTVYRAA